MSELHHCTTLTEQFQTRFKQYLLFLNLLQDPSLLLLLLDFLDVPQVIRLASTSKQLAAIVQIQGVEVRLLRAKLDYYQHPQIKQGISPILFCLGNSKITPPQPKKMHESYDELVKFNKEMRFYRYMKKEGLVKNKASLDSMLAEQGYRKFSSLENDLEKEVNKLARDLEAKPDLKNQWKHVAQQESRIFQKYKDILQQGSTPQRPSLPSTSSKSQPPLHAPSKHFRYMDTGRSQLNMQYEQAQSDYQRRKLLKEQKSKDSFIPYEKFKQMAEEDPCSREIFFKVYQDEKKKWQKNNVKGLTMKKPAPPVKEGQESFMQRAVKGLKGLRGLLWRQS